MLCFLRFRLGMITHDERGAHTARTRGLRRNGYGVGADGDDDDDHHDDDDDADGDADDDDDDADDDADALGSPP